jgi:hypothetical protein
MDGAEVVFRVYDGANWIEFATQQEALEFSELVIAAAMDGLVMADPEPVRPDPRAGERQYTPPNANRDTGQELPLDGVPPGTFAQMIDADYVREHLRIQPLEFVNGARQPPEYRPPTTAPIGSYYYSIGDNTIRIMTPDGWRIEPLSNRPMNYMNLQTAQGEELDSLARILGLERDRSWPHGIGRGIERDNDFRERMLTVIQGHLPPGVVPMHMELSQDGSHVNVNGLVHIQEPLEYVKIDLSVQEERHDIIDEESRWDQISEELFMTKSSGNDTDNE